MIYEDESLCRLQQPSASAKPRRSPGLLHMRRRKEGKSPRSQFGLVLDTDGLEKEQISRLMLCQRVIGSPQAISSCQSSSVSVKPSWKSPAALSTAASFSVSLRVVWGRARAVFRHSLSLWWRGARCTRARYANICLTPEIRLFICISIFPFSTSPLCLSCLVNVIVLLLLLLRLKSYVM